MFAQYWFLKFDIDTDQGPIYNGASSKQTFVENFLCG
jgi:hypothetical protein